MFLSLLSFPVCTVTLLEQIYSALEKIWDGKNPVIKADFHSPEHSQDWIDYKAEQGIFNRWKTEGFDTMKHSINSIVVVDLKVEQDSERPAPYFYFLDINQVIRMKEQGESGFEWIIFKQDDNKLAVFCDGYFRIFEVEKGSVTKIVGEPIVENEHELGLCPARYFWTESINHKEKTIKKHPCTNQLGKLDSLLFFDVGNEHLNLYARYPIYSGFSTDCDFENEVTGSSCDGGYLRNRDGLYIVRGENELLSCPVCANKRLDGPGSYIEIDPPNRKNDKADLRNPVQITEISKDSLDYNNEDIETRWQKIYSSVTGFRASNITNKQINRDQITAMFESQEAALNNPQKNFEQIMQWTDQVMCLLRYGSESFISASVSLGTEHFIATPDEIMTLYKQVSEIPFAVSALDELEDRYHDTLYRNNPEQRYRQQILTNLDPFRHISTELVRKMYEEGHVRFHDYIIKVNFSSFILRFERENVAMTEFGSGISFDQKINNIRAQFLIYADELRPFGDKDSLDLKTRLEMYGIAVRSGSITPQTADEIEFRRQLGAQEMSPEAVQAWEDDGGIRRPVTLKSQTQIEDDLSGEGGSGGGE